MAISSKSASGPVLVPENQNPKQLALGQPEYVATIDVIVTAESELAAVDRVADLGRRLTEDCEILDWRFQSLEPLPQNSHCDWKGGVHHGR